MRVPVQVEQLLHDMSILLVSNRFLGYSISTRFIAQCKPITPTMGHVVTGVTLIQACEDPSAHHYIYKYVIVPIHGIGSRGKESRYGPIISDKPMPWPLPGRSLAAPLTTPPPQLHDMKIELLEYPSSRINPFPQFDSTSLRQDWTNGSKTWVYQRNPASLGLVSEPAHPYACHPSIQIFQNLHAFSTPPSSLTYSSGFTHKRHVPLFHPTIRQYHHHPTA